MRSVEYYFSILQSEQGAIRTRSLNYLLFAVGLLPYYLLPLWAGSFIAEYQFDGVKLGLLLAADMTGGTIAALAARSWISELRWKPTVLCTVLVCALANFACSSFVSIEVLLSLRFVAGLAAGSFLAIVYADFAHSDKPDRDYSIALALQVLFGITAVWIAPQLSTADTFVMVGVVTLLPLILLSACSEYQGTGDDDGAPQRPPVAVLLALAAITLFFLSMTGVWVAMERLAVTAEGDDSIVFLVLSIGMLFSFLGAASPALCSGLAPRKFQVGVGYAAIVVALLVLSIGTSAWPIAIGIAVYNFFFSFVIPYQTAWVAETDESGRNAVLVPFAQGIGVSVGPIVSGALIGVGNNVGVIYVGIAVFAVSAAFAVLAGDPIRNRSTL